MNRRQAVVLAVAGLASLAPAAQAQVPEQVREPDTFRTDRYRDPVPATLRGALVVDTAGLTALIATRHAVLIDVLPAPAPPTDGRPGLPRLPLPHRDIPGSHWLAETGRGALPAATEAWFRSRLSALSQGDMARPLVFYCLSHCWMSWNAARRAVTYGYAHVVWFPGGADGWEAAGYPTVPASAELPPGP